MSLFNHFIKPWGSLKSSQISRSPWRMALFILLAAVIIPPAVVVVSAAPLYAPAFLATKVDILIGDDGDNQADPGETIEYTIAITNTGPDPATGVAYNDTIDSNTTLVGGSLTASPVGVNDTFPVTVVGNVSINSASLSTPFSVTANDYLGLNPTATIVQVQSATTISTNAITTTSANGGNVVMTVSGAGIGQFTYDPPAGFEGTDTFTYILADNANASSAAANRTATVSITVSGMVWFINNNAAACTTLAAGCGRLSNPFSTLAAYNTLNVGGGNNPAANDNIFIYESGTAYTGGVTLLSGQRLIGQDATQTLSALTSLTPPTGSALFPVMNSANGTVTNIGGAVTLNQNDTIRGLTISNPSGAGIIGTSISNLTVGSDVSLTGVTGNDLDLSGAASGTISFGATISNSSGRAVSIQNRSGGTVSLTGPISDSGGTGVLLNSNTGATITFSGGLSLSTGGNAAFTATSGGTVNVCATNPCGGGAAVVNTLTTTTGTALNVDNTTIGASDLTFRSISAGTGADSAGVGISLVNTGTSGGLHVTGSGTAGSGGTIQHKTGADGSTTSGIGIYLNNTSDVQLDRMQLNDFDNYAIRGLGVTGFTLNNSIINGTNGNNVGVDEGAVIFGVRAGTTGLTGTASVNNTTINGGAEDNLGIYNTSGTLTVTIDNVSINNAGNDGISVEQHTGGTVNVEVNNSDFTNNIGDAFNAGTNGAANINAKFGSTGANTVTTTNGAVLGGSVVVQTGLGWSGTGSANISNNTITGARDTPINLNIGGTGTFNALVNANTIGTSGVAGSGTVGNEDAIRIVANGDKATDPTPDGGTFTVAVTNNTIQQVSGTGIFVITRDGGTAADPIVLNVTITGNLLRESTTATANGIRVEAGASSTPTADQGNVCADIGGAGGLANTFSDDWGGGTFDEIRLRHQFSATHIFRLPGFAGVSPTGVPAYLGGRNGTAFPPRVASATVAGGGAYTGGAGCTQPVVAMLPNSNEFFVQNPGETSPLVQTQASSPLINPAQRFNTPLGEPAAFKLTSYKVEPASLTNSMPEQTTTSIVNTSGAIGNPGPVKLLPQLAPMAAGETVNVSIGTLPPAKSVTIKFRVTVNGPQLPLGTTQISNQGTVLSNELAGVLTDDPAVGGAANPTITPVDRPDTSVVSLTRQSANPNKNATVTWQIVFANPVSNLAAANFSLVQAGGVSGATISGVSETSGPPATTWNITAGTGSGDGTLELRMANDTGMSHDVTNLPYTQPASGAVYTLDKTVPTVTNVTSSTADGSYNVPDVISIQVVFSEVVNVSGTPQLTLETGTTDRVVDYSSGSGSTTLTFNYTVQAGDNSSDLDYVATNSLALNGGIIEDAATNNASLTLPAPGATGSLGANKAIVIDTTAPTTTNFNRFNPLTTPTNADTLVWQALFSEDVSGVDGTDFTAAGPTGETILTSGSTDTYTVTVSGGNLASFNGLVDLDFVASPTITDLAGNPLTNTTVGFDQHYVLDNTAPTVINVTSTAANGSYTIGAVISVAITFSEAVDVTGTPQLTLETGATDRTVNYSSGSGSATLTFNYTVQAGDASADLDYVTTSSLTLNGGTIRDATTNNAVLTLATPGAAGSLGANKAIVIDTTAPTVTNVTSTVGNGTYGTGVLIPVTITFSEPVTVTGTPQLTLETGATDQVVNYSSGSGTNTLTFNYTTQSGDTSADLDYLSTAALALNGGTIRDAAINNANLTLPAPGAAGSLGANKNIVIDANEPLVTNVSSSAANGSYSTGALIPVTVTFSEAVLVTGTPQLTLETGSTDAVVTYTSGSGSNTLTFNYTVQAGHNSPDLDYISTAALALNGGTIQDSSGNDAVLTLPAPGAAGSLGANKAIVIDTNAPDTIIDTTPANPSNSSSATFTFHGDDGSGSGIASVECNLDGGSFTTCDTLTSQNYAGPLADGSHTFQVRAVDAVGNSDPSPASFTWTVDTAGPGVVVSSTTTSPSNISPIVITITFDEPVSGFTPAVAAGDIVIGGVGGTDSNPQTISSTVYTFELTPGGQGAVTVQVPSGSAQDAASNLNTNSNLFSITYDSVAPTVILTSAAPDPTNTSPIAVTVTFSESVTGFTASDITPGNATVSSFAGSGSGYTFNLIPGGIGLVTADIAAGVATDAAGNSNTAAAQFSRTFVGPEIALLGNNIVIPNGDTSPSLADQTDFGSVTLGGAITRTFTISNSGTANLNLSGTPRVALSGPAAADFSVVANPVTPVISQTTTTFQVRFNPSVVGTRVATVTIASNDSNENPYTFVIAGVASSSSSSSNNIYLPLIFRDFASGPDLVIVPGSLVATSSSVTLQIRNVGNAPVTDAFWVDVYFNPTQTPTLNKPWQTIAPAGAVWGVSGAGLSQLTPGGTLTLTSGDAYYFAQFSSTPPLPTGANVFAQADSVNFGTSFGAVQESNEANNLAGPVISTTASGASITNQTESPSPRGLPDRE